MKARSIIFSAPMVRALLSDHKTQTRRAIKPPNVGSAMRDGSDSKCCPFKVGIHLWVKESWRALARFDACLPREVEVGSTIYYDADNDLPPQAGKSRVALFMPRWASRLTLQVTAVRAEPLQQISEADAIAEGVLPAEAEQQGGWIAAYRARWEAINGVGTWDDDCWVWVIEFAVVDGTLRQCAIGN